MSKLVSKTFNSSAWPSPDRVSRGASEDMDDAYGQVPVAASSIPLCIETVYDPIVDATVFFVVYEQPFGAEAAVPNCCRIFETFCRMVRRFLFLVMDHMFDDFFAVEPAWSPSVGMFAFRECARTLGYAFNDDEKAQYVAEVFACLRVLHDYSESIRANKVFVRPKPSRAKTLNVMMDKAESQEDFRPATARKFVGKYEFHCDTRPSRARRARRNKSASVSRRRALQGN